MVDPDGAVYERGASFHGIILKHYQEAAKTGDTDTKRPYRSSNRRYWWYGKAICNRFRREGAVVYALDRTQADLDGITVLKWMLPARIR